MSLDAECTVLGAILVDNQAFASASEFVKPEDFLGERNAIIFSAMVSMAERTEPIDLVTLKNQLVKMGKLDSVGGVVYLADLVNGVPRLENVDTWAKIIKDASTLRRLARVGRKIVEEASASKDSPEAILDRAEGLIFAISDEADKGNLTSIANDISSAAHEIEEIHDKHGNITGVPSGLIDLDRVTNGFQNSDLVIVAARPAMGKTSFCLNVGRFAAEAIEKPVAIFSLEMSKKQLIQRLIYSEARIDSQMVQRGQLKDADWKRITTAWTDLKQLPLFIDDTSSLTPLELRAKCRRIKREKGLGLVVIDYLQLMVPGVKRENGNQDIAFISRSLKGLAKELDVPVICLSQLSRKVEDRTDHRPQLADLRDSGAIEQDADLVMFIYRDEVYNPLSDHKDFADLIIAKNRKGPIDMVKLRFHREFTKFDNYVQEY